MGKFCHDCGSPIPVGNKYCANCGAPVQEDITQNTYGQNYTQNQYAQYNQPYQQNQYSQSQYNQPYYQGQNISQQPKKKSSTGLIIAIVAVALAVIIGLVVTFAVLRGLSKKGGKNGDTDSDIIVSADSDTDSSGKTDNSKTKKTTTTTTSSSTTTTSATTTATSTTTTTSKTTATTTTNEPQTLLVPIDKIVGTYTINGTTAWTGYDDHTYDFSEENSAVITFEDMTSNNLAMYVGGALQATGIYDPKTGACDLTDREDGGIYHVSFYLDGSVYFYWDEYYDDGHSVGSYVGSKNPQ